MAVRLDHHVHEILVVEGGGAALEGRVVELPGRRPQLPQQLREALAVLREPGAAALAVKVVLVPEAVFVGRRVRLHRLGDVLDVVAVERHQPRAAFGPQRRHHAGGAAAPVVAGQHRAFDLQRIEQREQVGAQRGLFARARRGVAQETRGAVAAQVRHDHAAALRREHGRHFGVRVDVVRKAVHQQHRRAVGGTRFEVRDFENARLDLAQGFHAVHGGRLPFFSKEPRRESTRRAS
jgi:hypothetical protein